MSILKRIFSGPETVKKVVEAGISGIDAIVYTEEEKAQMHKELGEWFIRYLEASEGQNLARRLIAVIIAGLFALLVVGACVAWPFNREYADFIFKMLVDTVIQPFSIVLGFYFLTHLARAVKRPAQTDG